MRALIFAFLVVLIGSAAAQEQQNPRPRHMPDGPEFSGVLVTPPDHPDMPTGAISVPSAEACLEEAKLFLKHKFKGVEVRGRVIQCFIPEPKEEDS